MTTLEHSLGARHVWSQHEHRQKDVTRYRACEERVTAQAFIEHAGITFRQLDTWTHHGHLKPLSETSPGSGRHREWLLAEVVVARCMRELLEVGFTLKAAAELARKGAGEYRLSDRITLSVGQPKCGIGAPDDDYLPASETPSMDVASG